MRSIVTSLLACGMIVLASPTPGRASPAIPAPPSLAEQALSLAARVQIALRENPSLKKFGLEVAVIGERHGHLTLSVVKGRFPLRIALASATLRSLIVLEVSCHFDDNLRQSLEALTDAVQGVRSMRGVDTVSITALPVINLDLAEIYMAVAVGHVLRKEYHLAVPLLRRAADLGLASAHRRLGFLYADGHGVPQDRVEAIRHYRAAADQEDATAQYFLGSGYATGQGVQQDYREAARWFRKSADHGYPHAMYSLAFAHMRGLGVPKSLSEAIRWNRLAAGLGDVWSQNSLAWIFATSPDPGIANAAEAIKLGKAIVAKEPTPEHLDTLAAAYARAGDFDRAMFVQRRVLTRLLVATDVPDRDAFLVEAKQRLALYQEHRPYTDDTLR